MEVFSPGGTVRTLEKEAEEEEKSMKKNRERQRSFPKSKQIKDANIQRVSLQSMNRCECLVANGVKLGGEKSVETMGGSPGQRGQPVMVKKSTVFSFSSVPDMNTSHEEHKSKKSPPSKSILIGHGFSVRQDYLPSSRRSNEAESPVN